MYGITAQIEPQSIDTAGQGNEVALQWLAQRQSPAVQIDGWLVQHLNADVSKEIRDMEKMLVRRKAKDE